MSGYETNLNLLTNVSGFETSLSGYGPNVSGFEGTVSGHEGNVSAPPLSGYDTFAEYWAASPEARVFWLLKTCVPPLLVVGGGGGNAVALVALRSHPLHAQSVGYYLSVLAACYLSVLVATVGVEWVCYMRSVALLTNASDSLCRICQFLYNVLNHCPYWLLALLLTDRAVYVCARPLLSAQWCTVFMGKALTALILCVLVTVNIHCMWTYGLGKYGCTLDPYHKDFYTTTWPWIAATINCYLPLLYIHVLLLLTSCVHACHAAATHAPCATRHTWVVLVTSLAFVLLTDPSVLLNLIQYSKPAWLASSHGGYARMYLLIELFQVLVWAAMALTPLLYFLAIPNLRPTHGGCCWRRRRQRGQGPDGMLMLQHSPLQPAA